MFSSPSFIHNERARARSRVCARAMYDFEPNRTCFGFLFFLHFQHFILFLIIFFSLFVFVKSTSSSSLVVVVFVSSLVSPFIHTFVSSVSFCFFRSYSALTLVDYVFLEYRFEVQRYVVFSSFFVLSFLCITHTHERTSVIHISFGIFSHIQTSSFLILFVFFFSSPSSIHVRFESVFTLHVFWVEDDGDGVFACMCVCVCAMRLQRLKNSIEPVCWFFEKKRKHTRDEEKGRHKNAEYNYVGFLCSL